MSDTKPLGVLEGVAGVYDQLHHDREVYLRGCIPEGARAFLSASGHAVMAGELPVGIAELYSVGDEIRFRAQYLVEWPRCAEAFAVVKALGAAAQFSLGFIVKKALEPTPEWRANGATRLLAQIEPVDLSWVVRGCAPGTRTLGAKRAAQLAAEAEEQYRHFRATVARVTPPPPPMSLADYFRLSDTEFMARMVDWRRQVA